MKWRENCKICYWVICNAYCPARSFVFVSCQKHIERSRQIEIQMEISWMGWGQILKSADCRRKTLLHLILAPEWVGGWCKFPKVQMFKSANIIFLSNVKMWTYSAPFSSPPVPATCHESNRGSAGFHKPNFFLSLFVLQILSLNGAGVTILWFFSLSLTKLNLGGLPCMCF